MHRTILIALPLLTQAKHSVSSFHIVPRAVPSHLPTSKTKPCIAVLIVTVLLRLLLLEGNKSPRFMPQLRENRTDLHCNRPPLTPAVRNPCSQRSASRAPPLTLSFYTCQGCYRRPPSRDHLGFLGWYRLFHLPCPTDKVHPSATVHSQLHPGKQHRGADGCGTHSSSRQVFCWHDK